MERLRRRLITLLSAGWIPPSVFRLGAVPVFRRRASGRARLRSYCGDSPPWLHPQPCHENGSPRRRLLGLELDDVAEPFQPALEVEGRTGAVNLVKVGLSEVAIGDSFGKPV
jgi:hypothetical protein